MRIALRYNFEFGYNLSIIINLDVTCKGNRKNIRYVANYVIISKIIISNMNIIMSN